MEESKKDGDEISEKPPIKKEDDSIQIRKDKLISFLKNYSVVTYVILAFIVYLAVKIRTSNLSGLKDIATGTWTLGPDLDPFLFLRWAKYIVENGYLMAVDTLRYFPVGFDTRAELRLLPFLMAWFHKVAQNFGSESVTHSAVIFPAFMFGLTVISFFFMVRKIFIKEFGANKANVIALISAFFLSVIPALLPRTIAGIPEKESAAFFFLFLSIYLFISAWETKSKNRGYLLSVLAGLSTGSMALIWGGYSYIFSTLGLALFLSFLFGKIDKRKLNYVALWMIVSFILMNLFSTRYGVKNILNSSVIIIPIITAVMSAIHLFALPKLKKTDFVKKIKLPDPVLSMIITFIVVLIVSTLFFGPLYVVDKASDFKKPLTTPVSDRFGITVAENRQPFYPEWEGAFGPHFKGIAISFWLIIAGSILIFYSLIHSFSDSDKVKFTSIYFLFLLALIFSRYKPEHILNGESGISHFVFFGGFLVFFVAAGFFYTKYYKHAPEKLQRLNFSYLVLISFFLIGIFSVRGSVRTIMMLVPPGSMMIGFLNVKVVDWFRKLKDNPNRAYIGGVILLLIIIPTLFSAYAFYTSIKAEAPAHVPSTYTFQWQRAMAWVREDTSQNAVFGHWWDYGYWVQSIGERATVLDGGNTKDYWNHYMGRHALTGTDNEKALEFLYSHNTTHFLIDSTDIGKYPAFSSIGSDINYDRVSTIPTFVKDPAQTQEKKNSTVSIYLGGIGLDEDIIYEDNGTRVFLPSGQAGLGAILVERSKDEVRQPTGIFIHSGKQYVIPLRYAYFGTELIDFGTGIEACAYIYPKFDQAGNSVNVDPEGAMLYLSPRVAKSQLARLYLYNEKNKNFKLVHTEDDLFVENIKSQNPGFDYDIVYYGGGLRGPIKIWEISYPEDIEYFEEYLSTKKPYNTTYIYAD